MEPTNRQNPTQRHRFEIPDLTEDQADAIRLALRDPEIVAFLRVVGALEPLSERQRYRALTYITDLIGDPAAWPEAAAKPTDE